MNKRNFIRQARTGPVACRYRDFLGIRRREEEIVTRQKQIGRFCGASLLNGN